MMNESSGSSSFSRGQGSRMKSKRAKVLHKIAGLEMVRHVVRSVRSWD